MTADDLRGAAIITASFLSLLAVAEAWMRLLSPNPELTRKLVHLGGGAIGLALPWLLESPLVVFVLTASLSLLFVTGEKTGLLESLHGVGRKSRGSEYYPLAIWLVFVIAADRPWLYLAAVLVLALADAFAALAGTRYGAIRYEVEDESKSVEGSLVFFFTAFLAVHLPMLLMTELPRAICVLAALLVAMLVTIFEAVSLEGTDNVFVPVAVVFVLQKITTKTAEHIAWQIVALAAIVAVVMLLSWRFRGFNTGGALTVTLFIFAAWSLGPRFLWVIPVFIGFAAFVLFRIYLATRVEEPLRVRTVTRALIVPFVFLLAANLRGWFVQLYAPYLAACAAVLAFTIWNSGLRMRFFSGWNRRVVAMAIGIVCAALIAAPMLAPLRAAIVVAAVAAVALGNAFVSREEDGWTAAPFAFSFAAGLLVLALQ